MTANKFSLPPKPNIDRSDMHDDHGVYEYNDDNITVISQPDFDSTLEAIADQPSNDTTILTPELAMLNDDEVANFLMSDQYRDRFYDNIYHRFMQLKRATKDSTNTILMGTPTRTRGTDHNSLQTIYGGKLVHTQNKSFMGPYERSLNVFEEDRTPDNYHRLGATAIICSELIAVNRLTSDLRDDTDKLLMSATWGVPTTTPAALKNFDTVDDYNADNLDRSVTMATRGLPNLRKLYVADRPMGESKQQTGRIKIDRTSVDE